MYIGILRVDELGINRHCDVQIDIGILRPDELGISLFRVIRPLYFFRLKFLPRDFFRNDLE
jgi:hypothetical protein